MNTIFAMSIGAASIGGMGGFPGALIGAVLGGLFGAFYVQRQRPRRSEAAERLSGR